MNKLLSLAFALGIITVPSAQAIPVAPLGQPQAALTIQVGYRYGGYNPHYRAYVPGYYPGPHQGYYDGRHRRYPYVRPSRSIIIYVDKGVCGFGSYLSCINLTCFRRCY